MTRPHDPATAEPDLAAMERALRSWSSATGGWASLHAAAAIVLVITGGLTDVTTIGRRVSVLLVVGAWTTTAIASWLFRRSFRPRIGFIAATASIVAGATMAAIARGHIAATADGIAHLAAGIGMAVALRHARPFLYVA